MKLAGQKSHAIPQGGLGTFVMFATVCATIGAAVFVFIGMYLLVVNILPIPKDASAAAVVQDMAVYCSVRGGLAGGLFALGAWIFKGNWFRGGKRIMGDAEERRYRAKMGK